LPDTPLDLARAKLNHHASESVPDSVQNVIVLIYPFHQVPSSMPLNNRKSKTQSHHCPTR